jgi:DNA-binding MarR family transcriptional regulator
MSSLASSHPPTAVPVEHHVLPALLEAAHDLVIGELHARVAEGGYADIRPAHGCVFRFVRPEGTRLTEMAERSGLTKQAVGEVVDDLEARGYVTRAPDPSDGRAKLVLLTAKGQRAQRFARGVFAEIEARWAERFGADRVADMRALLTEIAAS